MGTAGSRATPPDGWERDAVFLMVVVLLACAMVLFVSGCGGAEIVGGGTLPPEIARPALSAPIVLVPLEGVQFAWRVFEPFDPATIPAGSILGISMEDAAALQGYMKSLEAENRWLRSHPAFKRKVSR